MISCLSVSAGVPKRSRRDFPFIEMFTVRRNRGDGHPWTCPTCVDLCAELWFVSGRTCLRDVPVMPPSSLTLEFRPVTPDRLADLARFSRHHGKFRYCSCMRWRMRSSEFSRSTTQTRATALDDLVHAGTAIGFSDIWTANQSAGALWLPGRHVRPWNAIAPYHGSTTCRCGPWSAFSSILVCAGTGRRSGCSKRRWLTPVRRAPRSSKDIQ